MHLPLVLRLIGILIFFLGVSMSAPVFVSLIYKDGSTRALFYSMLFTSGIGLALYLITRKGNDF